MTTPTEAMKSFLDQAKNDKREQPTFLDYFALRLEIARAYDAALREQITTASQDNDRLADKILELGELKAITSEYGSKAANYQHWFELKFDEIMAKYA